MIEVFAEVVCPFTHVGLRRLVEERNRRRHAEVLLHVRAWPLELVNGSPPAAGLLAEEIEALRSQVGPDLFAGFDPAAVPSTTLPALALGLAAYDLGAAVGEQVALALRHAFFEEGRAIGAPTVLADLAAEYGVDPDAIQNHARVRADYAEGTRRAVKGSPHFFVGGATADESGDEPGDDEGFFCPGLDITHGASGFHIEVASEDFAAFVERCFG